MPVRDMLLALLVPCLWGTNFITLSMGVSELSPLLMSGIRLGTSGLLILPLMRPPYPPFWLIFWIAGAYALLGHGAMTIALWLDVSASLASIIDQLRVPFAVFLGAVLLNETIGIRTVIGTSIALVGVWITLGTPEAFGSLLGISCALLGGMGWALYSLGTRHIPKNVSPITFFGWISIVGSTLLLLLSVLFESQQLDSLLHLSQRGMLALGFLVIFGTAIPHILWCFLAKNHPLSSITPFTLLVAPSSIIGAIWLLDQPANWRLLIGGGLTLCGIAIIHIRQLYKT